MAQRLTSELIVKLTQQVSGPAAEAKKALAGVDQALAAIGKRREADQRLTTMTVASEKAKAKVRDLATAMAAVENPTKKMAAAYEQATAAADRTTQRLAQQRAAVASSTQAMRGFVGATETMAAAEVRLGSEAARAGAALMRAAQDEQRAARLRQSRAREMVRAANEEAAANQRAAAALRSRADAARMVLGVAATTAGMKAKDEVVDISKRAVDLDQVQRQQVAFGNVAEGDQKKILRPQADRIAQATRFTIPDVLTGQTRVLESLPSNFEGENRAAIAKAVTENAVNYALAIPGKIDMETAGHTVIAYLKALNKDISTPEKAASESAAAVNTMIKASKLSGLSHNDIAEFIRFGGAPGTFAGFSDPFKFAILAAQKRAGSDGALSGTFMRALAGYSVAPTKKGLGALADIGINYDSFVTNRKPASADGFAKGIMQRYGVKLTPDQRKRIDEAMSSTFTDESGAELPLMSSRERFTEAVMPIVEESFEKTKKGQTRATDKAKVKKDLDAYFNSTMGDVDVEGLFRAMVKKDPSMQVLNAFLGKEQGGRFIALLQQMKYFESDIASLGHIQPDFAKKIAEYLQAGLYGSQQNAEGSIETAKTKIGEAYSSILKGFYDKVGDFGDWLSGLSNGGRLAAGALLAVAAAGGFAAGGLTLWMGARALFGGGAGAAGAGLGGMVGGAAAGGGVGLFARLGRLAKFGLRRLGPLGVGFAATEGVVAAGRAGGYGRADEAIDESRARLKAQGQDWSPALVERMYDDYLSGAGPGRLKRIDDNEMSRRRGGASTSGSRITHPETAPRSVWPDAGASGQQSGGDLGIGIADGLGKQSGLIEGEAQAILDRLRLVFVAGVTVPVRLDSSGVQSAASQVQARADREVDRMMSSIHADPDPDFV